MVVKIMPVYGPITEGGAHISSPDYVLYGQALNS
jgi:hypothetical protein